MLGDPVIQEVARRHSRTPVQVTPRWLLQLVVVTIPKSVHRDRMRANLTVFDFELTDDDLLELAALDEGESRVTDSDSFGH